MGNLSKRERVLLIVLMVVVLGYVYFTFLLTPQLNKLKDASTTLESNKIKLENLKIQQRNLEKLRDEVKKLEDIVSHVEKAIPDTAKIPEVIVDIQNMTITSGCIAGPLNFGEPTIQDFNNLQNSKDQAENNQDIVDNKKYTTGVAMILPLTYQIKGNYNSIMALLSMIEKNSRMMIVDNISIDAEQSDSGRGMLTANLGINAMFRYSGEPAEPVTYDFMNINLGKSNMFE